MKEKLGDLRYLYLACQIEEAFEGLEKGFGKHLTPLLRKQIEVLFQDGPNHRRLKQAMAELNQDLAKHETEVSARDLLQAICDCERLARDFYQQNAGKISDPKLAEIFRGLAAEEQSHLAAAERALAMAG
ncbi:MAG: hypothetical protein WC876_06000 [Candidatus Thermoplasmatota archaeon]